jgi:peptidoglycan/xylan/chitin deacetylase (PgdA/CDA1 family)
VLWAALLAGVLLTPAPAATAADQITRVAPGQREVALLFNADSIVGRIPSILETLRAHRTRLTFFLTGNYLEKYPAQVRAIHAAGQEIASHGYDHSDYRNLSDAQIVRRLDRWQETFKRLTGQAGPRYWQPPYGYSNNRVRQAALDHGYSTIYWTLDSLDAVGRPKSRAFILNRVLQTSWVNLDGAIILMHVNGAGTVAALPEILDTLERRGLRAVTISELRRR